MQHPSKPSARSLQFPGRSRADVARAMGISVAEVARNERSGLLKCRAEFERRGWNLRALISLLTNPESES
jgi:hypothetical protein